MVKTSLTSRATVSFIGERRSINTNWLLKSSVNGQVISNYSAMPYTLSTDGKRRFGGPAFLRAGPFFCPVSLAILSRICAILCAFIGVFGGFYTDKTSAFIRINGTVRADERSAFMRTERAVPSG